MRLAHRDTMDESVVDDVVLDQDILVEHRVAGAAGVDHLVAHEDRLRPSPSAAVQKIIADSHPSIDYGRINCERTGID